ncbi:MAG: carbon-nitrogen family hydrolase [Ectobacillus sp.]
MKVACLQLDVAFGDVEANVANASKAIEAAMIEAPDVIVLPELWTTGYDLTRLNVLADIEGSFSKRILSDWAKQYKVNIVGGSIPKQTAQGITNTMYMFDRSGVQSGEYSKVHLFQLMDEHKYLIAGNEPGHFVVDNVACAGLICYDIRFPEWVRTHTTAGADVLFIVAEWPLPRVVHWRTLLQARAIENQCYIVACNRTGSDPNNLFAGHSIVIDPWGEIVAESGEEPGQLVATLNLEKMAEVRKGIPVFADRRPDLYK